jgi:hypothetical protein
VDGDLHTRIRDAAPSEAIQETRGSEKVDRVPLHASPEAIPEVLEIADKLQERKTMIKLEDAISRLMKDFKERMEKCGPVGDQCNDCKWETWCIHVAEWRR